MCLVHIVCIGGHWEFDSCHSYCSTYIKKQYTWLNGSCQTISVVPAIYPSALHSINQAHLILVARNRPYNRQQQTATTFCTAICKTVLLFQPSNTIFVWLCWWSWSSWCSSSDLASWHLVFGGPSVLEMSIKMFQLALSLRLMMSGQDSQA